MLIVPEISLPNLANRSGLFFQRVTKLFCDFIALFFRLFEMTLRCPTLLVFFF